MSRRPIQDCYHPWTWLNVDARGLVKPCCHATLPLGNINEMDFEEIWNGDPMVRLRGAIHEGHIDPICRNAACSYVTDTELAFGELAYIFRCKLDQAYSFATTESGTRFCSSGWSAPESWGTWSDGPRAVLALDLETVPSRDLAVHVFCRGVGSPDHPPPAISIGMDGRQLARWEFSSIDSFMWKSATLPASAFHRPNFELVFDIDQPLSPSSWDAGDGRQLGIGLSTLKLSAAAVP